MSMTYTLMTQASGDEEQESAAMTLTEVTQARNAFVAKLMAEGYYFEPATELWVKPVAGEDYETWHSVYVYAEDGIQIIFDAAEETNAAQYWIPINDQGNDPDGYNEARSDQAAEAIEPYLQRGADREAAVLDLLADLMHFCDVHGIDFNETAAAAARRYTEETTPEETV